MDLVSRWHWHVPIIRGFLLSGGSIQPGCYQGREISILDVYDVQAQADAGVVSQAEAEAVRRVACPGPEVVESPPPSTPGD